MDEIDAALDFRNVSIVANYIKVKQHPTLVYFKLCTKNGAVGTNEECSIYCYFTS